MKKTWLVVIGIIVVILLVITAVSSSYNGLITKQEKVNSEFANLDTQLQRRADLIPNLVSTVKGYTKQEFEIYNNLAEARTRYVNSVSVEEKLQANAEITNSLNSFLALTENYPDLKSEANFTRLHDELAGTENRIAVARKDYNEVVQKYNTSIKKFPTNMMANMFGFEAAVYFEANESGREVPNVNFE